MKMTKFRCWDLSFRYQDDDGDDYDSIQDLSAMLQPSASARDKLSVSDSWCLTLFAVVATLHGNPAFWRRCGW